MSSTLLSGLIDDAALYPPGNAPMPVAVADHVRHTRSTYADLIGPFLCPPARLDELAAQLSPVDVLAVGLVLTAEDADPARLDALQEPLAAVTEDPRLRLAQVELPIEPTAVPGVVAALRRLLPPNVPIHVELPWTDNWRVGLAAIRAADRAVYAKFRTGGLRPGAVPPTAALAQRIVGCTEGPVSFKCTAGLHSALRTDDQHGFLNIMAAAGTAALGGTVDLVSALLDTRDPRRVLTALRTADTRGAFLSFGSCSIGEPVTDLVDLGLLPEMTR